jgi:hypothetical protein
VGDFGKARRTLELIADMVRLDHNGADVRGNVRAER